jgi:hypothetical protein
VAEKASIPTCDTEALGWERKQSELFNISSKCVHRELLLNYHELNALALVINFSQSYYFSIGLGKLLLWRLHFTRDSQGSPHPILHKGINPISKLIVILFCAANIQPLVVKCYV